MATSTKNTRKANRGEAPSDRSGLPNSTVQRANLGGGQAEALNIPPADTVAAAGATASNLVEAESAAPGLDEISLRAYFLGEERREQGRAGDEISDWLQAENELLGSTRQQ